MPTIRQRKAAKILVENGGKSMGEVLRKAEYSPKMVDNPQKVTNSKGWKQLMDEYLPDDLLSQRHMELLNATRLDHMVFPLGPADQKELELMVATDQAKAAEKGLPYVPKDYMTDKHIEELLKSVNCTVRKIVHGETGRHVYFWGKDNKARKEALDMAYKLKGKYAPEKTVSVNLDLVGELSDEDKKLIELIREYDRNPRTEAIPPTGNVPVGLDTQPQNKD